MNEASAQFELIPEPEEAGERLDKYLSLALSEYSRSYLAQQITAGNVSVSGKTVKSSYRIREGEHILLCMPEPEPLSVLPENLPLSILYEDDDLLVINKPQGMVVHPAAGHTSGTLVNAILYHCRDSLSGINGILRPGIVHRIDKDTSGLLVICKNDAAHLSLAEQLKEHSITRKYRAIVSGVLKGDEGTVDSPIARDPKDRKKMKCGMPDGRRAVTHYRVLRRFRNCTYIECQLETGRTHQIRVHMASIGHPVLGDQVYGPAKNPYHLEGQTLHAMVLGFRHPRTGEYMEFTAPLPAYFSKLLETFTKQE